MAAKSLLKKKPFNPWHLIWISVVISQLCTALLNVIQYHLFPGMNLPDLLRVGAIDSLFVPILVAPVIIIYFIRNAKELEISNERLQREITDRKRAEESLSLQSAIARNIAEGIYLVSIKDLKIVYANPRMEEIFGYDPGELNGKHVSVINAPAGGDPVQTAIEIEKALTETGAWRGEVLNVRKDGTPFWGHATISKLNHPEYGEVYVSLQMDITERKRAENALRDSEKRLNDILDNVGAYVFIKDTQYRYTYANRKVSELLSLTTPEILGKSDDAFFSAESVEEIMRSDRRVIEFGETVAREEPNLSALDSLPRTYWTIKIPLRDNSGQIYGLCGISTDITDRNRAEDALLESESRFRAFMDSAPDACLLLDTELNYLYFNKAAEDLTGIILEQAKGKNIADFFPGVSKTQRYADYLDVLRTGEPRHIDAFGPGGIFGDKQFKLRLFKVGDNLGVIWTDITEIKKAEEALLRSTAQYRSLYENMFDGYAYCRIIYDDGKSGDFVYQDVNPAFERLTGLKNVIGRKASEIIPGIRESNPEVFEIYGRVADTGIPEKFETYISFLGLWFSIAVFSTEKDHFVAVFDNITERKRSEEVLRQSGVMMRSILDSVDEGFIVVDRDYRIQTANRAYCDQAGLDPSEVIGRNCFQVSHHLGRPCYEEGQECAVRNAFKTGEPQKAYHKHSDRSGNFLYVETKAFPLKDASGTVTLVIESISNITEKRLLEEERLKTQKLEAIGTLAGGIAHDFNNLLQGVFGYISLAKVMASNREKSVAALDQAEQALQMSVKLTNQLLTFSRGGKPVMKPLAVRPLIENAARFALSGSRSDFRIAAEDALWQVEADEGQIAQVIQNIVLNSDQAMPGGGQVTIRAKNVQVIGQTPVRGLPQGRYVVIVIKDNGIGIPEQYFAKIFDPYFTTKEKGSGLGLATSYSIIRNHGGLIEVNSKVGKGSTFYIYLPAAATQEKAEPRQPAAVAAPRRAVRILVMDDEPIIRDVAGELIRALGHEVDVAEHGEEAIAKYRTAVQAGKPFDVVILDLTIRGGMGGRETLRKLQEIDPAVKAIVSSGYSDDSILANHLKEGFKAFLKKPYHVDELHEVLNRVLDA